MSDARTLLREFWKAPTIAAAASLGVADHMADATDADSLAGVTGVNPAALARLLRALATLGLVEDRGEGRFALTDEGQLLRSDHPQSIRGMARHIGTMLIPAFQQIEACVRSGAPPEGILHGPHGFAELLANPTDAHIFNQSMVDSSRRIAARAADAYDFSGFACLIDVGGGYGAVLATLLQRHPQVEGAILDMAHARDGALAYLEAEGVASRARFIEGSFFDPLPNDADCYLLKYIIHDWNDGYATRIIERVGEAVAANDATLILIERILPERFVEDGEQQGAVASDLTMMLWDGCERTEAQFAALLRKGNLALTRAVPIGEAHYVIEARRA